MSWQGHLFWAVNDAAWWWIGVASASATTLIAYRSPDLITWTAKTTKAMAATLNGEGRNLCVVYKNIASTDVVQLVYTNAISASSHKLNTIRATISGGAITYGTEQLVVAGTANSTDLGVSGLGACFSDDNFLYIGLPDPTTANAGDAVAYKASNADLGSSWTTGYAAQVAVDTSILNKVSSTCVTPLASHKVLLCYDNGAATPQTVTLKNVLEKTLTGTTISPTPASTAGNGVFTALGTAVDADNYGVARLSDTDTHAVLRTASNTYSHKRFNGTDWTTVAGVSIPAQTSGAGTGVFLCSNGTDVWLFVVDSDAANTIRYIKWTAASNTWGTWTALETTTKTRKFLSGNINSAGTTIGVIWSETNGANFDVMVEGLSLATAKSPPPFFRPLRIWNRSVR